MLPVGYYWQYWQYYLSVEPASILPVDMICANVHPSDRDDGGDRDRCKFGGRFGVWPVIW